MSKVAHAGLGSKVAFRFPTPLNAILNLLPWSGNKGDSMFARKVSMQLKPNGVAAFKNKIENEIIPVLRKQKGFLDEITFLYPNGKEVHAFSLWETAEDAEAYNRGVYPALAQDMAALIEGVLRVQTYEVLSSTVHKLATSVSA
jgi:hypothetical protein